MVEEEKIKYAQLYDQLKKIEKELEEILEYEDTLRVLGRKTIQINAQLPLEDKLDQAKKSQQEILKNLTDYLLPNVYQKKS